MEGMPVRMYGQIEHTCSRSLATGRTRGPVAGSGTRPPWRRRAAMSLALPTMRPFRLALVALLCTPLAGAGAQGGSLSALVVDADHPRLGPSLVGGALGVSVATRFARLVPRVS